PLPAPQVTGVTVDPSDKNIGIADCLSSEASVRTSPMRFARFLLLASLAALFPLAAACSKATPPAPAQSQPNQAQPVQPPSSGQAYQLPPDKLAKAKTLNKIELTLGILGSLWGLAVLWLLLRTQSAAAMERWAQRRSGIRWIQGLFFFASFFVITFIAGFPLDAVGHVVS